MSQHFEQDIELLDRLFSEECSRQRLRREQVRAQHEAFVWSARLWGEQRERELAIVDRRGYYGCDNM